MRTVRRCCVRWMLTLAAVVMVCFSPAVAQTSYQVTDLGALNNGVLGCAMGLNNQGWTESMDGYLDVSGNFVGRAVMNITGIDAKAETRPRHTGRKGQLDQLGWNQ